MANRWRLGFAVAASVWTALLTIPYLIAPAQAQAPGVELFPSHPEPVSACDACDGRAWAAMKALGEVLSYEKLVAWERSRIFELRAWLAASTNQQASSAAIYRAKSDELVGAIDGLDTFDKWRVAAQQELDALMKDLADCNAACKDRRPTTTPSSANAPGPSEEAIEAECPDCEGKALELKADLARLRYARFVLEEPPLSKANDIFSLQNELQSKQKDVAEAEKDVADDRIALDACNRAHPRTSCQPPSENAPQRRLRAPISDISGPTLPGPGADVGDAFNIPSIYLEDDDDDDDTGEAYYAFVVPDSEDLHSLLADPFIKDKDPKVLVGSEEGGGGQMTIAAGANRDDTEKFLVDLQKRGVINSLESDVCWRFRPVSDPAAAKRSLVPAPGAWVLYTPVSPSPSSDPGERPGDEGPPTIARVGRDGRYNAPPGRPKGSVEVRVAKGCNEQTTVEVATEPIHVPVAGATPPDENPPESNRRIANAIRASELKRP